VNKKSTLEQLKKDLEADMSLPLREGANHSLEMQEGYLISY